jgi:hypothetical protein
MGGQNPVEFREESVIKIGGIGADICYQYLLHIEYE